MDYNVKFKNEKYRQEGRVTFYTADVVVENMAFNEPMTGTVLVCKGSYIKVKPQKGLGQFEKIFTDEVKKAVKKIHFDWDLK